MWASLNLLALLAAAMLAIAFGDRTIRSVSTILVLGVVATIFAQRVTRTYDPGLVLMGIDIFMFVALLMICSNAPRRWCWVVAAGQAGIVLTTIGHVSGLIDTMSIFRADSVYLYGVAAISYVQLTAVIYALLDRYVGDPLAPPQD